MIRLKDALARAALVCLGIPELATFALGRAVAIGDVDDDGFGDLIIAADQAAGPPVAYVLRGGANPTP